MKNDDPLHELRRLLDPKTWPLGRRRFILHEGEVYWFKPSGDPNEERIDRPLYNGRFQ